MKVVVGFVGVGTIATAMVHGILASPQAAQTYTIVLSPRGTQNTQNLIEQYPDAVTVAKSNQEVVNRAQWVILSVLPPQVLDVMKELYFPPSVSVLLSVVSCVSVETLKAYIRADAELDLVRAVPLPPVQRNMGATLVFPQHEGIVQFYNYLGEAFVVESEDQVDAMMCLACVMGPHYRTLQQCSQWTASKGVDRILTERFLARMFQGLAVDVVSITENDPEHGFQALVDEQTPGGLNEGNIKALETAGVFDAYSDALDVTLAKLTGQLAYESKDQDNTS